MLYEVITDNKGVIKDSIPVAKYVRLLQMSALLGINPIITLGAFWGTELDNIRFLALPVLGVCALGLGGVLGYSYSRLMNRITSYNVCYTKLLRTVLITFGFGQLAMVPEECLKNSRPPVSPVVAPKLQR